MTFKDYVLAAVCVNCGYSREEHDSEEDTCGDFQIKL